MLYELYQAHADALAPMRVAARMSARGLKALPFGLGDQPAVRSMWAAQEVFADTELTHVRRPFAIDAVPTPTGVVDVVEEVVDSTPFGHLLRFAKPMPDPGPRVLVLAPLSGHFATLLRDTVVTLLPDHDVYITDWVNAREVPLAAGRFGFDEYVDHVVRFLGVLGPGAHLLAVCQPCVQGLAATAVMAEARDPNVPRTLTLMAGPIDTRINPTKVNELATSVPIDWFEQNVIATVPWRFPGAGRRVYPGFLQLTAFLAMNPGRHLKSHFELYTALADGEVSAAATTRDFYDEYFAVLDLTAEFYLETVERVFQTWELARGELRVHDRPVDPAAIDRTLLLTVEGERDDICSIGQTMAAHDLCSGLSPHMKQHHLQPNVGHYGVFSGRRWERQVYPRLRSLIASRE
ncbi:polyhydroxyalkanoate depolymerase [Rhabdothermincola salaria]|uniref:polyhydroxyalkanoate depolymerase n=1 Tax=Rhabdothermincola salaria TaxID=2903142 RepID=UPI001E2CAE55|nr:polyhydroxyalkanoate depolymerase [Rhabdothermincola salaria]MCD9623980.1 polyhydroxyalkanoate depolymerase [Rhabdothermincola salaria]